MAALAALLQCALPAKHPSQYLSGAPQLASKRYLCSTARQREVGRRREGHSLPLCCEVVSCEDVDGVYRPTKDIQLSSTAPPAKMCGSAWPTLGSLVFFF